MIQITFLNIEWDELDAEDQIDQVCDWYEQALRLGQCPSPLEFATKLPQEYRAEVLDHLTQLQQVYKQQPTSDAESIASQTHSLRVNSGKSDTDFELARRTFSSASSETQSNVRFPIPFGSYILMRLLGSGAFGDVFLGQRVGSGVEFAVKVPRPKLVVDEHDRRLLIREAKNAEQLDHPGIVRIRDHGVCGSTPFVAYDYIPGMTLKDYVKQAGALDQDVIAELIADLADAVHHAHEQGIIHRDIKPANVLLKFTNGRPDDFTCPEKLVAKLSDFGISKRLDSNTLATVPGEILGTPAYMSPEQAAGNSRDVNRLSDIYSLGAVMHELLIGETPFVGESSAIIKQIEKLEIPPILKRKSSVDLNLANICQKALRLEPCHRYQSAKEFAEDIRRHQRHEPIMARPVGTMERTYLWAKRHPTDTIWATFASILILVAGAFAVNALLAPPSEHPLMAQEGLLRSAVQSELPIEEWMHQLPASLAKPEPFLDRLGKPFDAKQIRMIAEKLRPHAASVSPLLLDSWKGNDGNVVKQAPIACLIGMIDARRFDRLQLSDSVVEWLMRSEIAQDHEGCGRILQSLKQQVAPSLVRFYASSRTDKDRASAFDQLDALLDENNVDLAIDGLSAARPQEFDVWRAELSQYHRQAAHVIRERLLAMGNSFQGDEQGEAQARICGNLLMMEFGFGTTDLLWPALSAPIDPRPRVYFAHQIGLTSFDLTPLFERLRTETDSKVAYSILLAFSQTDAEKIDRETLDDLKVWVSSSYRTHPAAGVHSMCRFLLRQWGRADEVRQADQALITDTPILDREWYVNSIGMTMRAFRAPTVTTIPDLVRDIGSKTRYLKWNRHELTRSFAVSIEELNDAMIREAYSDLYVKSVSIDRNTVNTVESRIETNNAFELYNRFLQQLTLKLGLDDSSQSIRFPDESSCFVDLNKKGFRLPTREEWHAFSRCGFEFESFFGSFAMYHRFAYGDFSDSGTISIGHGNAFLPNQDGVFGSCGRVREWTSTRFVPSIIKENAVEVDHKRLIKYRAAVFLCGHDILSASGLYSSELYVIPERQLVPAAFRVAQSL